MVWPNWIKNDKTVTNTHDKLLIKLVKTIISCVFLTVVMKKLIQITKQIAENDRKLRKNSMEMG